jgi:hypothetical protein
MSSILQKQIGTSVPTGIPLNIGETFACYTGRCEVTAPTVRAIIRAWALITTGSGNTGMVLRIRRGSGLTGPSVAGGYVLNMAAGVNADTHLIFAESLNNAEYADYSLTLMPQGANAAGLINISSIEVELING